MILSIIVPLYNVEKYIEKCILSLENQDINKNEYEIIVVDDGSPDDSVSLIEKLQKKYLNIKLYRKKNGGLSSARNYGLKHAVGQFVWFVDSDDWVEANTLGHLYESMTRGRLDCLWFKWRQIDEKGNVLSISEFSGKLQDIVDGASFLKSVLGHSCYACMFWFRREWLSEMNFMFTEGVLYEDVDAIPRLLLNAKRVKFENYLVYNYFMRSTSILHTYNPNRVGDLLKAINVNVNLLKNENKLVLYELISYLIISLMRLVSNPLYYQDQEKVLNYLDSIQLKLKPDLDYCIEIFIYNKSKRFLLLLYKLLRMRRRK